MRTERVKVALAVIAAGSICWVGFGEQKRTSRLAQPGFITKILDLPIVPQAPIPGETLRYLEGQRNGFKSLSFAVSLIEPGSGPPPHRHGLEEAHIVLSGKVAYRVGAQSFVEEGPFIARIPAGVEHSLKNVGKESVTVVGVFPTAVAAEIDPK
jgi:quercetin dioxygenase-like cupin family protein